MENQCAVIKLTISEPSSIKLSSVNSSQEYVKGSAVFLFIHPPKKHPVIGPAQRWRCMSCSTVRITFESRKGTVDEFLRLLGCTNSLK